MFYNTTLLKFPKSHLDIYSPGAKQVGAILNKGTFSSPTFLQGSRELYATLNCELRM